MLSDSLKSLALETVQSPQTAAERIVRIPFSRDELWSGLVLVSCLNSIIYSVSLLFADTSVLPPFLRNPLMFFFIITGILVLSVHAFYWAGRAMGGQGDLGDLLKLMVWLQGLRAVAQAILVVLMLIAPLLGSLFSLAVGVIGLWITVNFINVALNLGSAWRAFGVLVVAGIGLVFGLVLLAGMIGIGALGVPTNV